MGVRKLTPFLIGLLEIALDTWAFSLQTGTLSNIRTSFGKASSLPQVSSRDAICCHLLLHRHGGTQCSLWSEGTYYSFLFWTSSIPKHHFSNVGNSHTHNPWSPRKLRKNKGNDMSLLRNIATLSLLRVLICDVLKCAICSRLWTTGPFRSAG